MTCCLHPCLKCTESVVACCVSLLTNLILFNLANVIKLICDRVAALINHMDSHVWLRVIAAQSCIRVHHLCHGLALLILELEAHVIWIGAELAFEELLALGDGPIEIEAQLGQERTLHAGVRRI